ncbi:MAG: hypothetical protein AB4062_14135 [Crocosphaera sp.]
MNNFFSLFNQGGVKLFLVSSITLITLFFISSKTHMILKLQLNSDGLDVMIDSRSNHEL